MKKIHWQIVKFDDIKAEIQFIQSKNWWDEENDMASELLVKELRSILTKYGFKYLNGFDEVYTFETTNFDLESGDDHRMEYDLCLVDEVFSNRPRWEDIQSYLDLNADQNNIDLKLNYSI